MLSCFFQTACLHFSTVAVSPISLPNNNSSPKITASTPESKINKKGNKKTQFEWITWLFQSWFTAFLILRRNYSTQDGIQACTHSTSWFVISCNYTFTYIHMHVHTYLPFFLASTSSWWHVNDSCSKAKSSPLCRLEEMADMTSGSVKILDPFLPSIWNQYYRS